MSVTGTCPRCGFEKAVFLNIDSNGNIAVDCPPNRGCDFQAAVTLDSGLDLIDDEYIPIALE
jgi:transcription elongation factor Elf1